MVLVFEKCLTTSEIRHKRLFYPTGHLDILPFKEGKRDAEFHVSYGESEFPTYLFRCLKRGGEDQYDKPTISTGWSNVVRDKKLEAGDMLKFYMEQNHPAPYYIEVYRKNIEGVWCPIP